jgi:TonB family protein
MYALVSTIFLVITAFVTTSSTIDQSTKRLPTKQEISDKQANDTGRFEIRDGTQNDLWLDSQYRDALWRNDAVLRELNGQSPRLLEEYLLSSDFRTAKQVLDLSGSWKSGNAMHTWVFDEPYQRGGLITRALELEDLSGPSGYHVQATVHCYDAPEYCKAYNNRQMPLLAPKPATVTGDLAQRQWRNRVTTESCTAFAKNMRQPRYPDTALRNGIEGSVMVGIFFNSCGNVRDAWVQQSSGNRELDRAAVSNALKWQIDTQSLPKHMLEPGLAKVPVKFLLGEEPAFDSPPSPIK